MARFKTTRTTLGAATAAVIATSNARRRQLIIQNVAATALFIGGPDVTASGATTGLSIAAGSTQSITGGDRDSVAPPLYGIITAGGDVVVFEELDKD